MRRLGQEPGRPRVDREELIPVFHRIADESPGPVDARVADDAVEAAEAGDRLADHAGRAVDGRHVAAQPDRIGVELAKLVDDNVELGGRHDVDSGDADGPPRGLSIARQSQTGGPADSTRGSGHDDAHVGSIRVTPS